MAGHLPRYKELGHKQRNLVQEFQVVRKNDPFWKEGVAFRRDWDGAGPGPSFLGAPRSSQLESGCTTAAVSVRSKVKVRQLKYSWDTHLRSCQ